MEKNKDLYSEEKKEWIARMAAICEEHSDIDNELYTKYEVKRGLRDLSGQGVLTGLTEISEVRSYMLVDLDLVPCEGKLFYQGIDIEQIVEGFLQEERFGFEEVIYLLLFGSLPNQKQLGELKDILAEYRMSLKPGFVRDIIMKAPSTDLMNTLGRSVLTLYSYDKKADDISTENVLRQCLQLISMFPMFSVYGYQASNYFHEGASFFIHAPKEEYSIAENILHMLRPDSNFTELEAKILDIALVLHAEHGGGNNSTFTNHVVSSSGTDTYSTVAASLGSLKGPRHGGANIKVSQMFVDMKKNISNWESEEEIKEYLRNILEKKAFDESGLIYGMGHAVYSLSDPRANILKRFVRQLSEEKGYTEEFKLYSMVEQLAPELIGEKRKIYKGVSANVDFYSGLLYNMLEIPYEMFTPLFAIARIAGWSAHRLEELINKGKIIRPAYKAVSKHKEYQPISER
ncbi:MAG: citrate/2-methylcitrate synthase [Lachnoclostridium sp.]|nr:citrate/2-methylcitrate synthase [Lachnoclostridium sp.]